jgi:hypothetical protein
MVNDDSNFVHVLCIDGVLQTSIIVPTRSQNCPVRLVNNLDFISLKLP